MIRNLPSSGIGAAARRTLAAGDASFFSCECATVSQTTNGNTAQPLQRHRLLEKTSRICLLMIRLPSNGTALLLISNDADWALERYGGNRNKRSRGVKSPPKQSQPSFP